MKQLKKTLLALTVIGLQACGGGGGGGGSTPPLSLDTVQGVYDTTTYSGSGLGLSAAGDGLVLFDSGGTEATPRVQFGAATTGSSFYYAYDTAGNPDTSPNLDDVVSTPGTLISASRTILSATSSSSSRSSAR